MKHADDRSTEVLLQILLQVLKDVEVGTGDIAVQCYDGASVMSGTLGGC